jgi:hypothetical protein
MGGVTEERIFSTMPPGIFLIIRKKYYISQ